MTKFKWGNLFNIPPEGIPMERHGEMGRLFYPKNQLNLKELTFYAEVNTVCDDELGEEAGTRDQILEILYRVAQDKGYSKAICKKVIAYFDELAAFGDAQ
jgi:hypothetical protein